MEYSVNKEKQFSGEIKFRLPDEAQKYEWLRASADFSIGGKEWNPWLMTQFIVELKTGDRTVSSGMIRAHRALSYGKTKRQYIDLRLPNKPVTEVVIKLWNANGQKAMRMQRVRVEVFRER